MYVAMTQIVQVKACGLPAKEGKSTPTKKPAAGTIRRSASSSGLNKSAPTGGPPSLKSVTSAKTLSVKRRSVSRSK